MKGKVKKMPALKGRIWIIPNNIEKPTKSKRKVKLNDK